MSVGHADQKSIATGDKIGTNLMGSDLILKPEGDLGGYMILEIIRLLYIVIELEAKTTHYCAFLLQAIIIMARKG